MKNGSVCIGKISFISSKAIPLQKPSFVICSCELGLSNTEFSTITIVAEAIVTT